MKPNNLIALLIVAILLAIGIALAVIHQRSERAGNAKVLQNTGIVVSETLQKLS